MWQAQGCIQRAVVTKLFAIVPFPASSILATLTADERDALAARGQTLSYARKSVLYLAGDTASVVYVLQAGQIKLSSVSHDGRAITLCFRHPGDIFGEAALFSQAHRLEMAECSQPSTVVAIETADMLSLLNLNPQLSLSLLRQSVNLTCELSRKISALMFQNVAAKVADALLQYYQQPLAPGHPLLTHRDLASIIGSTRETVSATLARFRAQGLIAGNRLSLEIRDREGLLRLAASGNATP